MVTPTSTVESKHSRFQRLATSRTKKVLVDLRLLRQTFSNNYEWTEEEANKIHSYVLNEIKLIENAMNGTPGPAVEEFSLNGSVDKEG